MKIVIDARLYGPRTAKGLGRYVQQIVEGLKQIDHNNQYIVLLSADNFDEFKTTPNFQKVLAPWRWYSLAEQIFLPGLLKKLAPGLVHFPHFNVPIFYRGKFVLTIHDLLLRRHHSRRASRLGPWLFWLKKRGYLLVTYLAIRRAQKIIAVSEFTKQEISHFYPGSTSKITVIYEGLTSLSTTAQNGDDKAIFLRYNITRPYLLYVGNGYPHKNLETACQAFELLRQKWSGNFVIVGGLDYFLQRLKKQVSSPDIIFTGYVPDSDLSILYRQASVYVFPSLYEGFGLPPLEAMAQGSPVACSDIPCLKEICGAAAEYFSPQSADDMAKVLEKLLNNPGRQIDLRCRGLEQIKRYDWSAATKQHLDIYLHAHGQNKKITQSQNPPSS